MEPQLIYIINSGSLVVPRCAMHPFVYDDRHEPVLQKLSFCIQYSGVSESRDGESISVLDSAMAASTIIPTKAIQLNQQEGWRLTQRVDASLAMPIINKHLYRAVFGGELCK